MTQEKPFGYKRGSKGGAVCQTSYVRNQASGLGIFASTHSVTDEHFEHNAKAMKTSGVKQWGIHCEPCLDAFSLNKWAKIVL